MFQAFKRTWVAFFGTISNIFEATEFGSNVIRTVAEEASLTQSLESGATIRNLTKQLNEITE
jgi:hypothetical protein